MQHKTTMILINVYKTVADRPLGNLTHKTVIFKMKNNKQLVCCGGLESQREPERAEAACVFRSIIDREDLFCDASLLFIRL